MRHGTQNNHCSSEKVTALVLAAGDGKRMQSALPKVVHTIAFRPMLDYVLQAADVLASRSIVVASAQLAQHHDFNEICTRHNAQITLQQKALGTADAVKSALGLVESEYILILYGDVPFIKAETLLRIYDTLRNNKKLVILAFEYHKENTYGRVICDADGIPCQIIEHKEYNPSSNKDQLCNAGICMTTTTLLQDFFKKFDNNNNSKEYYLTDLVNFIYKHDDKKYIGLVHASDHDEVIGINDKLQLAAAETILQNALRTKFLAAGVTMIDPKTVYFASCTSIASDVVIHPYVCIGPNVSIASDVTILPFTHLEGVSIGDHTTVGPFSRIRGNTKIDANSKIGNFVEIKESSIGKSTKASHLTYIGDATIGNNVNIGAGTIFCNYDGNKKHHSTVGDRSFIGSNTAIVSPIQIGTEVLVGAGSTITHDVPSHHIAIARSKQNNLKKRKQ